MTLEEIKRAIADMPPDEIAKLRAWLAQLEAGRFERKAESEPNAEPDTPASKFGRLAGRAVADFRKRLRDT
jgi:hypothetical protein